MKGGYLLRSASLEDGVLALVGDLNSTTAFEIIAPIPSSGQVSFNGEDLTLEKTSYGTLRTTTDREFRLQDVTLPDLSSLSWVCSHLQC